MKSPGAGQGFPDLTEKQSFLDERMLSSEVISDLCCFVFILFPPLIVNLFLFVQKAGPAAYTGLLLPSFFFVLFLLSAAPFP